MEALIERLLGVLDGLMPATLREADGESLRRARLLVGMIVVISCCSLFLCVVFWKFPFSHPAWLSPVLGLSSALFSLASLHKTKSHRLPSIYLTMGLCLLGGVVLVPQGGLLARTVYWLPFFPLLAMFLLGRGWGLICAFTLILVLLFIHFLPALGFAVPPPHTPSRQDILLIIIFFNVFTISIGWLFETSRQKALSSLLSSMDDIRHMEIAKNAAELANQTKSDFLAMMSHELRTPLNAIIGYSEILEEELADRALEDELGEDLDKISSSGRQLLSLIEGLLNLSHVGAGEMKTQFERFSLIDLLGELESEISFLASQRKNSYSVQLDENIDIIFSDRRKLAQCLFHLLDNACKFTHDGAIKLRITGSSENANTLIFQVEDSGIGIPEPQLENIFQQFFQVDNSNTRKFGGSGLGLAITKEFVLLLGGRISVRQRPEGGSIFQIDLPCAAEMETGLRNVSN